jgi:hypothetical protein
MQKHPSRLPIILILITLLSAADWAVAGASSRMSAWHPGSTRGFGGATTFSGEPDQPAIRSGNAGNGASGGNSKRLLINDATEAAGFWIRMFEVRYFGR